MSFLCSQLSSGLHLDYRVDGWVLPMACQALHGMQLTPCDFFKIHLQFSSALLTLLQSCIIHPFNKYSSSVIMECIVLNIAVIAVSTKFLHWGAYTCLLFFLVYTKAHSLCLLGLFCFVCFCLEHFFSAWLDTSVRYLLKYHLIGKAWPPNTR